MFTGIIEKIGVLKSRSRQGKAGKLTVACAVPFADPVIGESIAVNGCCLSLEQVLPDGSAVFHTMAETLDKTNLGLLPLGSKLNLERALRVGDRLGGHWVSGHVDGVGEVLSSSRKGDDFELKIAMDLSLRPFIVPKGSIAVDGVSLTVVECGEDFFTLHLIPLTLGDTALPLRKNGMTVNLETDMIGKYIYYQQQQLPTAREKSPVTMDTLREAGFI